MPPVLDDDCALVEVVVPLVDAVVLPVLEADDLLLLVTGPPVLLVVPAPPEPPEPSSSPHAATPSAERPTDETMS